MSSQTVLQPSPRPHLSTRQGSPMGCDQFTPHTTIHVPSLKRVLQPSPSPPTPSDPDAVPSLTLDALPSDILFHIATFLEPPLEPYTQDGFHTLSPSDSWCDPGVDLLRFASTCRVVYRAVSSRLGVHFGLTVSSTWTQHPSWEVMYGPTAPVPVIARPENDSDAARRVLSTLLASLPLLSTLTVPFPGTRIRHLFLHTVVGAEHGSFLAPHLIKHMPRLETFAYVHATANDVVLGDSWSLGAIGWATLAALAKCCPDLREIYLSGAAARRTAPRPEIVGQEGITFGDQLERITLAVSGDGLCRLLSSAPALKRVVVWREFTMAPTSGTEDWWWTDSSWKTVEALELRGFSGNTGRPLLLAAVKRLNTLRSLNPTLDIPLRSLTLSEPHQFETLSADILPAFANLPHLTSLSFLVWRSRAFNPAFITGLAEKFPHLTELSIGLETEALHYWAGSLDGFAKAFSNFHHLTSLTWNHTPYANLDFPSPQAREFLKSGARKLAHGCPSLVRVRWFGEDVCLVKRESGGVWKWTDALGETKEPERLKERTAGAKGKGKETIGVGRKAPGEVFRGVKEWVGKTALAQEDLGFVDDDEEDSEDDAEEG